MPKKYLNQWNEPSDSNPNISYVVSLTFEGEWECSCPGWTQHFPRRDCKHIKRKKADPEAMRQGIRFAEM